MSVSYTIATVRSGGSTTISTVSGASLSGRVVNDNITITKPGGGTLAMADLEGNPRLQIKLTSTSYSGGELHRVQAVGLLVFWKKTFPPWVNR